MQSNTSAWARVQYVLAAVRSVFSEEKELSIAALSQTLPARRMLQVTPWSPLIPYPCLIRSKQKGQGNVTTHITLTLLNWNILLEEALQETPLLL